jgi:hypothetical protein
MARITYYCRNVYYYIILVFLTLTVLWWTLDWLESSRIEKLLSGEDVTEQDDSSIVEHVKRLIEEPDKESLNVGALKTLKLLVCQFNNNLIC